MSIPKATFPTQLILAGTTYQVSETPELKAFFEATVQAAAQREKDKLYTDLEAYKLRNQTLTEQLTKSQTELQTSAATIQQQMAAYDKQQLELSRIKELNNSTTLTQDMILQTIQSGFEQNVPKMMQQYLAPVTQYVQQQREEGIAAYRQRAIDACNGELIVELVKGTTPEEIDASIATAKDLYNRYKPAPATPLATQVATGSEPPSSTTVPVTAPVQTVVPVLPRISNPENTDLPDISQMSPEEFAQNRDAIMAKLKGQFAQTSYQ